MVKMINKLTGTMMWVAEERVEEYKAAGHLPAVSSVQKATEKETTEKPKGNKHKK